MRVFDMFSVYYLTLAEVEQGLSDGILVQRHHSRISIQQVGQL